MILRFGADREAESNKFEEEDTVAETLVARQIHTTSTEIC